MSSSIQKSLPEWRTNSNNPPVLNVEKNGEIISTIRLNATHTVFGRTQDHADVTLDHNSISRKHAVIFFKDDDVYLMDLKSSHGTEIEENPVETMKPTKVISGQYIQFGKSSRKYFLESSASMSKSTMDQSMMPPPTSMMPPTVNGSVRDRKKGTAVKIINDESELVPQEKSSPSGLSAFPGGAASSSSSSSSSSKSTLSTFPGGSSSKSSSKELSVYCIMLLFCAIVTMYYIMLLYILRYCLLPL